MQKVELGKTGLWVSKLAMGMDTRVGANFGGRLLKRAFELEVNFWDTSDDYGTHPAVREGLRGLDRAEVVLATKTYTKDTKEAAKSVERALKDFDTDYVDLFHLHAEDTAADMERRQDVLNALVRAKEKGLIRAVALSSHSVEGVRTAARTSEIDAILAVINKTGGRMHGPGGMEEMLGAVREAYEAGKGIYAMKVLARGNLAKDVESALGYVLQQPFVHSASVGMKTLEQLEQNVAITNHVLAEAHA